MNRKAELIRLITLAYADEQIFIAGLSSDERFDPGSFENWCAKDVIVHNAAWKDRMAQNLDAASRGLPPSGVEDYNHQNTIFYQKHCNKTWEETLVFANQAFRKMLKQVESLSEASLDSLDALPWQGDRPLWRLIVGNGYAHPVTHLSSYYRQRGDLVRAGGFISEVVLQTEQLDDSPAWQGVVHYNTACQYALLGSVQQAISELRQAFVLAPDLIPWSQEDNDLDTIRDEPGFKALLIT